MVLPDSIDQYRALNYTTVVSSDERAGKPWFVARHSELPGCMSDGATPEEAIENLRHATELYIASLVEDGLPVPMPEPQAIVMTIGTRATVPTHRLAQRPERRTLIVLQRGDIRAEAETHIDPIPV